MLGRRHGERRDEYVDDGYEEHSEDHVIVEPVVGVSARWTVATAATAGPIQMAFEYEHDSNQHLEV